jgi:hypothetical protein
MFLDKNSNQQKPQLKKQTMQKHNQTNQKLFQKKKTSRGPRDSVTCAVVYKNKILPCNLLESTALAQPTPTTPTVTPTTDNCTDGDTDKSSDNGTDRHPPLTNVYIYIYIYFVVVFFAPPKGAHKRRPQHQHRHTKRRRRHRRPRRQPRHRPTKSPPNNSSARTLTTACAAQVQKR